MDRVNLRAVDRDPEPEPDYVWYVEVVNYDYDPLYRFGIEGDEVLLRTDPTVTTWGEDYWGYWDEPYTMVNNQVFYTHRTDPYDVYVRPST